MYAAGARGVSRMPDPVPRNGVFPCSADTIGFHAHIITGVIPFRKRAGAFSILPLRQPALAAKA